jgi:hypothetical protein
MKAILYTGFVPGDEDRQMLLYLYLDWIYVRARLLQGMLRRGV